MWRLPPPLLSRAALREALLPRERESSPVSRLTGKKVIARLEATRHRPRTSFAPLHHHYHPFLPSFLDIANVSPFSVGERSSTLRFHSRNTHTHTYTAADTQQQTHRERGRDHTHTRIHARTHAHTPNTHTEGGRSPLSRIPFPPLPLLFSFYALVSLISFQPVSISHPFRMRRRISIPCEESMDFVFDSILK